MSLRDRMREALQEVIDERDSKRNMSSGLKKYIVTKRFGTIELTFDDRGLWVDAWGCVYAERDQTDSSDKVDRCGIWPVVIPVYIPEIEEGCMPHEFMHTSTAYQLYNTVEQSNLMLQTNLENSTRHTVWNKVVPSFFRKIADAASPFLTWARRE